MIIWTLVHTMMCTGTLFLFARQVWNTYLEGLLWKQLGFYCWHWCGKHARVAKKCYEPSHEVPRSCNEQNYEEAKQSCEWWCECPSTNHNSTYQRRPSCNCSGVVSSLVNGSQCVWTWDDVCVCLCLSVFVCKSVYERVVLQEQSIVINRHFVCVRECRGGAPSNPHRYIWNPHEPLMVTIIFT